MDYTESSNNATHSTGQRMHKTAQTFPTVVEDNDLNAINWELMEVIKAADIAPKAFDADSSVTYKQFLQALQALFSEGDHEHSFDDLTDKPLTASKIIYQGPSALIGSGLTLNLNESLDNFKVIYIYMELASNHSVKGVISVPTLLINTESNVSLQFQADIFKVEKISSAALKFSSVSNAYNNPILNIIGTR